MVYLMSLGWEKVVELKRTRPKNWPVRTSAIALFVLGIGSWTVGDFGVSTMFSERRVANLANFLGELRPYPLQSAPFDVRILFDWVWDMMRSRGLEAAVTTVAISVVAIFIAGCGGAILSVLGARTLVTASPYLPYLDRTPWFANGLWGGIVAGSRLLMMFARSIPEYIWAFLFLAMIGPIAWPLVLALALHNTGILGRLGAEVVENTESPPLASFRALGATRTQMIFSALFPLAFSRFLLFFLYRWETCVREATVLGMLGISSLGFWIQDARSRNFYDEMFFLILLGAFLVVVGDLLSALAREWVRRQN